MEIPFVYGHGSGNVFPIVDAHGVLRSDADWAGIARALSNRAGPVGSDGLLLLVDGDADHAFGMRMFNADGSEAETCLNGLRLVARLGFERLGLTEARVKLRTSSAGVARAADLAPGVFTVRETAGPAGLDVAAWPIVGRNGALREAELPELGAAGAGLAFTAIAMPNPHLVAFVEAIDEVRLVAIGELCEAAPAWLPNRANVSFVEVRGGDTVFVRTFERGVGLTDSCGSAMAASAVATVLAGHAREERELIIRNRGGFVRGSVAADLVVTLSGNATFQWEGRATVDAAAGVARDLVVGQRFADEDAAWSGLLTA